MAQTLHFRGSQIGDHLVGFEPDHQPQTRPVVQRGLFQATATLSADSTNMLYAVVCKVSIVKATSFDLVEAIGEIQKLANLKGDVELKEDAVTKLKAADWTLSIVSKPDLLPGFGGRFTDNLLLRFEGETPLIKV